MATAVLSPATPPTAPSAAPLPPTTAPIAPITTLIEPEAPAAPVAPVAPPAPNTGTKQVRHRAKDGTIRTYTYHTIGGLTVKQYQKNYAKSYYEPRVRVRKYKKLPDEVKKLAFRLRSFGIGCGRIAKIINTDVRFPTVYVGEGTVELLLLDKYEESQHEFKPFF